MLNEHIENLIIGAGPAGLAMAGRMRNAGIDFVIIEQSDRLAQRWRDHYDRLHLHTVKRWSHLPYLPFPDHYPVYISKDDLVKYYEQYARHFVIEPRYGVEVLQINRVHNHLEVMTQQGAIHAKHVILATGANRVPNVPVWEAMDTFKGKVIHSRDYHNADQFRGSRALVIGMGNTGAEIALDLARADVPTWISVRGSVNIVPRDLNGRPVQETSKLLARLPFHIGDWIGSKVQRLYFGDLRKYGITVSTIPPAVELRTTGRSPVIDIGTVDAIKEGRIRIVGKIGRFTPTGIKLQDGEQLAFDHVILATGYRPRLRELVPGIEAYLDAHDYPHSPIGNGQFDGLYFLGFDNYKLGGILGTIYHDSKTVMDHLTGQLLKPHA
jgi:cation diffusion facilitator CzcD-associated flavoprotein CzcO